MPKKIYAIKEGFDYENNKKIQNVIVDTWPKCLKFVKGVKGAKYKSFVSKDEAIIYLQTSNSINKSDNSYPKDCMHIYVDGSYNSDTNKYAYGFVAIKSDVILHIEGEAFESGSNANIRQIAGELKAAIKGAEYALNNHEERVVIFHDYVGISNHATGAWDRKEQSSKEYYEKMQSIMNSGLNIIFVKVDSHTGDLFNEMADEICKINLNIQSDNVVSKYLKTNKLNVINKATKDIILTIAPESNDNIEIVQNSEVSHLKFTQSDMNFEEIIYKFKDDNESCKKIILDMNQDIKNKFIFYLLENKI